MIAIATLTAFLSLLPIAPTHAGGALASPAQAVPPDGSRILFIGDSITQAGDYVVYVESFLLTRYPDRVFTIINHGLSSETAAGTSEPDHPGRRPCIHDRFDRDVTAWAPDIVVACYGMDDGIYHPFDPDRFERYKEGIDRLIDRARLEARARIDLLTPPPYDPYRRQASDPDASDFGYRYPVIDYDRVLERYSEWLRSLTRDDLRIIDVNHSLHEHVRLRREQRASFSIMPDGIHPDPTGHFLMALALLRSWGVTGEVAEAHIDATSLQILGGEIAKLSHRGGVVDFTWRSPLPMPVDPRWDPQSLLLERISEDINRYRLRVTGLDPGRYRLLASGSSAEEPRDVGTFSAADFEQGIDLTAVERFPTVIAAHQVLEELAAHRSSQASSWRESIRSGTPPAVADPGRDEQAMLAIRDRCQPRDVRLRLEPIRDREPTPE